MSVLDISNSKINVYSASKGTFLLLLNGNNVHILPVIRSTLFTCFSLLLSVFLGFCISVEKVKFDSQMLQNSFFYFFRTFPQSEKQNKAHKCFLL